MLSNNLQKIKLEVNSLKKKKTRKFPNISNEKKKLLKITQG